MNLDRRSFIGSILGLYAGSKLPFFIEEAKDSYKISNNINDRIYRMIGLEKDKLFKFKMIIMSGGIEFFSPKIEKVEFEKYIHFELISKSIEITREIKIDSLKLIDDENYFLREKPFIKNYNLLPKDILTCSYELNLNLNQV